MKHILPFLKPYKWRIALAMVLVATATVCDLLLPTIMSNVLNNGVAQADFAYIVRCCWQMLLTAAVGLATLISGRRLSAEIVANFNGDLRASVFAHVNNMSFEEFNQLGTAALLTRSTHDIGTVSWVASIISGSLITIPVLVVGGVVLAMRKDVVLSLILLAFVPLVFLIVLPIGRTIHPLHREADKYIDIQNDIMRERLHGIRVIRAFNKEPEQQEKIAYATHVMAENIINANVRSGLVSPLSVFILNVAVLLMVYIGGFRMQTGVSDVSGGDIFALIQYVALIANGILMAGFAIVMLPAARVAAGRIGEIFETRGVPDVQEEQDVTFSGGIRLDHVSFRYEGADESAISDISLEILPGQKVAVIGGTGSGKSTLVQMLLCFRNPTSGRVYFDGVSADTMSRKTVRRNISCVLQKTAVYSGTIRHNIEMGRPGATDAEILAAANIAQLGAFIASLPDGLDHEIEQSGKNLSGGQKQRLCIARAILKDAPVYIFDDSFSALDFLTEANLRRELNEKISGKTQIVITQRVTSAMRSDQIFVMDRGRLIDHGTHTELLARCGIYREIYASQTGGEQA